MRYTAITPPDWLANSAIYQINPRTFSPEGTINAITAELPALAELGFKVIYLCPIFEEDDSTDRAYWSLRQKKSETNNPKNPYRMNDYFKIDSEYGTMDDLQRLIETAHSLGQRVILDLVYLHIGPNASILKTHPEFARQDKDGNPVLTEWFFPYLDYSSEGLREYLWCNMVYYISALDADGFRCDVGDKVPLDFWVEGRRRIKAVKQDAVLINEGRDWGRTVSGFDACYCFDWHEKLYSIFANDTPTAELRELYEKIALDAPDGITLVRDIDNHDTATDWPARTEVAAGHDGMEQIEVINYLIDGVPMVYCGNEYADTALHSMFANRFYMGKFEVAARAELKATDAGKRRAAIMKNLNDMKQNSALLRYGKTVWVDTDNEETISFMRVLKDEKLLFIGNPKNSTATVNLPEEFTEILMENGAEVKGESINLLPRGYIVFKA